MKFNKILKNKKIKALVLCGMVIFATGCSANANEDKKSIFYNYYTTNKISLNEVNNISKHNYSKLNSLWSTLKDNYGNPNKTSDVLEYVDLYTDKNLNIKKAKFTVLPFSLHKYNKITQESKTSLEDILNYMKDEVTNNINNLNTYMKHQNINHIETMYSLFVPDDTYYYNVHGVFNYINVGDNTFVKFSHDKDSGSTYEEKIQTYFKVIDNKLVKVDEENLIASIDKAIENSTKLEDDFGFEIMLETLKEGDYKNIGGSSYKYSKEDVSLDSDMYLTVITNKNIDVKFDDENKLLDNKDALNLTKDIENSINNNFEFLSKKNLIKLLSEDDTVKLSYIAIDEDSNNKTYSRLSLNGELIESYTTN